MYNKGYTVIYQAADLIFNPLNNSRGVKIFVFDFAFLSLSPTIKGLWTLINCDGGAVAFPEP